MTEQELEIGEIYYHTGWPKTEYLAIQIQSGRGLDYTERKTMLVLSSGSSWTSGRTVVCSSEEDPEFWAGFYPMMNKASNEKIRDRDDNALSQQEKI